MLNRLGRWTGVAAVALAVPAFATALRAQSPREHVMQGDREYGERRVAAALTHYAAAIVADSDDFDALWKASRAESVIGESLGKGPAQDSAFAAAARFARLAVAANPQHAEVMRLNGAARSFARTFLGGEVFGLASWSEATRLLEKSVAVDPEQIGPRLDLGAVYSDVGNRTKAREQFEWIARAPERGPNEAPYKQRAAARLRKL